MMKVLKEGNLSRQLILRLKGSILRIKNSNMVPINNKNCLIGGLNHKKLEG